jgi:hypothetical protein
MTLARPHSKKIPMQLFPMDAETKKNLLFAELRLPIPDKAAWVAKCKEFDESLWFYDHDRDTRVLPLRNRTAQFGYEKNENFAADASFRWTPAALPDLVRYFQDHIFPWVGTECRVAILKTAAGARNHEHIDCSPADMDDIQHKFRLVLQGRTDSLYFITDAGTFRAPETELPFLIDGRWPHGMYNAEAEEKYTLVLGAPWTQSALYPELGEFISRAGKNPPPRLRPFFNKRYLEKTAVGHQLENQ